MKNLISKKTLIINGLRNFNDLIRSALPTIFFTNLIKVFRNILEILIKKEDQLKIDSINKILNYGFPSLENLVYQYSYFDVKDKKVLDIGAYNGDSTIIFKKLGAREVIAIEALKENCNKIVKNLLINKVSKNVKVKNFFVSDKNGYKKIKTNYYDIGSIGFGSNKGNLEILVRSISWKYILKNFSADIIKVDIEGNEKYLAEIDDNLIKKIKFWIIEVHSKKILFELIRKFFKNDFKLVRRIRLDIFGRNQIIYFRKDGAN